MHIQAFRIAEQLSLPVMVCMDGFILTHAYDEVDIPDQEKVDAFVPPFEPRQLLDPADPMTIGAMVGPEAFFEVKYLAHAKQMQALDVIPEVAPALRDRLRATLRRPGAPLPDRGRRDDHRRARLRAGDDRGGRRRDARRRRQGGRARHQVLPAVPPRGGPRSSRRGLPRGGPGEGPGPRPGRHRLHRRPRGDGGRPRALQHRDRRPGREGDHPRVAAADFSSRPGATSSSRSTSSTWTPNWSSASWPASATASPPARMPRTCSATSAWSRRSRTDALPGRQALPDGHLRGRRPAARSGEALGAGADGALQHAHLRAPRLPGMRRGARRPIRPRLRDAGHEGQADRGQRHGLPRGLLDPLSGELLAAALDPFAVRQRAGGQHRDRRGAEGEGPRGHPRRRAGRRRRHARHRLRLPLGDVRAKRRRAVHLLRQRGLHEHRRPALGRDPAGRAHRQHQARRRRAGQRLRPGQERAADRDGARDPLRRDRDRGRAARPRVQGREGDGVPGRPLPPRLRPLPARLGLRLRRHGQDRPPRQGERHLPRLRGRGRRGGRRLEDPQAGAGRPST